MYLVAWVRPALPWTTASVATKARRKWAIVYTWSRLEWSGSYLARTGFWEIISIKSDLEEYFDSFDLWHKATVPQPGCAWEPTRALRSKFFLQLSRYVSHTFHPTSTFKQQPVQIQNHPSNNNMRKNLNKSRHKAGPVRHGASFPPNILVVVQLKQSGMMEV